MPSYSEPSRKVVPLSRPAPFLRSLIGLFLSTLLAVPALAKSPADTQDKAPERGASYYHYALGHNYEEMAALTGRSDYANRAIEEYKKAIEADPRSEYLNAALAELYARTNRIRDAVVEAQNLLKRDPDNVQAHKLLGRIYLGSLGDLRGGGQSAEMLKLAIEQYEHVTRLEPKNNDALVMLGRLYLMNKDYIRSEQSFKTALKNQPAGEEPVTFLAYLYNEQGNSAKAEQVLSALPEGSRSARSYAALGYTYDQLKETKKAIEAWGLALKADRRNTDFARSLAQDLLADGQTDKARDLFRGLTDDDPQDPQGWLKLAEIQRRAGQAEDAVSTLKKGEEAIPDSLEIPYHLAITYSGMGRFDDAIAKLISLLDRTVRPDGNYPPADASNRAIFLERLGTLYRETGKHQQALDTFRQMLELGDDIAPHGYQQIIETYRDEKQWEQATAAAEEAVKKAPQDRTLKLMLAQQLGDNGRLPEAVSQVRSLLKNNKDDRGLYLALSQIYSRAKRWKEAEAAAAEAEKLSETAEDREEAYFNQGSLYERQKKFDQAEERFRRVLASEPKHALALNYLGYMLAERGVRLEEAVSLIQKALDLEPQNGAYLDSIGWAYFKQGKYELAEENLLKAISRNGNDATLHDHLGELYHKTGRLRLAADHWARALEEWNRAASADVDSEDVARVQKELASARIQLAKQQPENDPKNK